MQFTTGQARRSDIWEVEAYGLGPRDRVFHSLIARREQATEASVSASLLGLPVTYEGKMLDQALVVLHRSPERTPPRGDSAPQHVADRPVVPGEFLG